MCYLVTGDQADLTKHEDVNAKEPRQYESLPDARKYAEYLALSGVKDVRIWLLTHSVSVEPRAVWREHAKALSGNGKE